MGIRPGNAVFAKPNQARAGFLVVVALLYTGLNSLKPLQVDDAAYYYYAAQIAQHPLDPYGFNIFWYEQPLPANHVLAPPFLLYWWAAGIRLFGQHAVLWKLWLFPLTLLFTVSVYALARRFAHYLAAPLTVMTVFGPAYLPSLNLMLDIPALAWSLGALALFFRACDRRNWSLAVVAGLMAGIAMETKYTAFLAPATMLLYAGIQALLGTGTSMQRMTRLSLGVMSTAVAAGLFVLWEWFIASKYGESHFLHELSGSERDLLEQLGSFAIPLFALVGGVAPALALLGLLAFGAGRKTLALATAIIAAGFALIAWRPESVETWLIDAFRPFIDTGFALKSLEQVVFIPFGFVVVGISLAVAVRLLRLCRGGLWRINPLHRHRRDVFLVSWLLLEIAGYFALTPFGAVRRILGVTFVATLLVGRLAALACQTPGQRQLAGSVVLATVLLGLLYFGVDWRDAWASKQIVADAARMIRSHDPNARIWFTGHWGFQFYAEANGMRPLIADQPSQPVKKGDWVVAPCEKIEQQMVALHPFLFQRVQTIRLADALPLRTVRCFYGTFTGAPLEHEAMPRISVAIYRARLTWTPTCLLSQIDFRPSGADEDIP